MKFEVNTTTDFQKSLKKLVKKYPSIIKEYAALIELLETNPKSGIPLGKNCFKIRISISSKGKGKSGGARVITYVRFQLNVVTLLDIFDKSDLENITETELQRLLLNVPEL
jgi:mRNA-degrading endonuclease RelE of RelBE toxin-antitoxin system